MLDALTFDAGSTLTPDYMLMLDSRDITGNISDRLMRMKVTDKWGFEAGQLDVDVCDGDGRVG
ncbi:phage late control D family protein, partial [Escherichia coli]|nr:phage late control D family protein [Escherichia coli]